MVKIPKRTYDPFLNAKTVENDEFATITAPPYIQPAEKNRFGKERTVITIRLKKTGDVYRMGLNGTSSDRLVEAFGDEGDLWRDKEIKIKKSVQNVRGEDRAVLYVVPYVNPQKPLEAVTQ